MSKIRDERESMTADTEESQRIRTYFNNLSTTLENLKEMNQFLDMYGLNQDEINSLKRRMSPSDIAVI